MTTDLHVHSLRYTQQFLLETNFFNRKQTKLELTTRTLECCLLADIGFRSIIFYLCVKAANLAYTMLLVQGKISQNYGFQFGVL